MVRGFRRWAFVAAGLAALVVLLLGAVLAGPPASPAAVTPIATASPTRTPATTPTAAPTGAETVPLRVFFARDQLPPVGATVRAPDGPGPDGRIVARIRALMSATAATPPSGSTNPAALIRPHAAAASGAPAAAPAAVSARIQGDLATVELDIADWGVRGAAATNALVQQLVYTITEEPGIRRARIVERGKTTATIDQLVLDAPLAREDVFGYAKRGALGTHDFAGDPFPSTLTTSWSVDGALTRFMIAVSAAPELRSFYPRFTVTGHDSSRLANARAELEILVHGGEDTTTVAGEVDRGAVRSLSVGRPATFRAQTYRLGLEDLRPWRAVVLFDPTRIVIDVGGPPSGISDDGNTVVYSPAPGSRVERSFRASGAVRAFEAAFQWRVRDSGGRILASGRGMANIGTSPVWGGYELDVSLPGSAQGAVTLEVFQQSPKDGAEVSLASVGLTLR